MSQYEYYEFQAVDRRLGENDMQALRACSSRAQITPVNFLKMVLRGAHAAKKRLQDLLQRGGL